MADGSAPPIPVRQMRPEIAVQVTARWFTPRASLSTKEAAAKLGCSVDTVRRYLRLGILRSSQPGSTGKHRHGGAQHRIPLEDVEKLLAVDARDDDDGEGRTDG